MIESSASTWWWSANVLGQAVIRLETSIGDNAAGHIGQALGALKYEADQLQLKSVTAQLGHIEQFIEGGGKSTAELRALILDLVRRIQDEFSEQKILFISTADAALYLQEKPLFGDDVADAFPDAIEDISEAGKSLALGRHTASVFHLMRAMEAAVQRLCGKLGIENPDREWGKLLSDIHNAIAVMPKGELRNTWSEAHANLYHVKQAWRNNTMHPKQTYTEEEARAVLQAVRTFMTQLAGLV